MSSMVEKLRLLPLQRVLNRLDPKQVATLQNFIYVSLIYFVLAMLYRNQRTLLGLSVVIWFFVIIVLTKVLIRSHYDYEIRITCSNCGEILDLLISPLGALMRNSSQVWTSQFKNSLNLWIPFLSLSQPNHCPNCEEPLDVEVESLEDLFGCFLQGGVVGGVVYALMAGFGLTIFLT